MRRLLAPLTIAIGLAVLGAPRPALAQPSPDARAAAAALFEAGRKLAGEGKFAEACPKLEDSQKMDPGMGTLFYLSDCYEKIGRTMSAWVGFREVAAQARLAGQGEREKFARSRIATLEPQLMRLKVVLHPGVEASAVAVTRDGSAISPAVFGTPVPLDPGAHELRATAAGKEAWESKVVLEAPGQTVTIEIPALLDRKPGAAEPAVPLADKAPVGPQSALVSGNDPAAAPDTPSKRGWQRPLGITMTAVGAVGLGVGSALGLMAKSIFDDSAPHCNATNHCDSSGIDLRSSAVGKGNAATGVFIAGAALAAGGVVLWITAPPSKPASPSTALSFGPGSAMVQGSF